MFEGNLKVEVVGTSVVVVELVVVVVVVVVVEVVDEVVVVRNLASSALSRSIWCI